MFDSNHINGCNEVTVLTRGSRGAMNALEHKMKVRTY